MFIPSKHRIRPSAHPDLCLATIPPGGRSGGWDRSIWEERTPLWRSWCASPPTSPAAQRSRRREALPRRGRRRHVRRGRGGLPAGPGVPGLWRRGRLEGRVHRGRGPEVALPMLRQEVHLPHGHSLRELPQAAYHHGYLHQAHAPQRPRRVRGQAVRRHPQDGLRVSGSCVRHGARPPGPNRAARHRLG